MNKLKTDCKKKAIMRASVIHETLDRAGIEANLIYLSVTNLNFRLQSSRMNYLNVLEELFLKWDDIKDVSVGNVDGVGVVLYLQFEESEFQTS